MRERGRERERERERERDCWKSNSTVRGGQKEQDGGMEGRRWLDDTAAWERLLSP